jgi:hypothetical protein
MGVDGGGIFSENSSLTVQSCEFSLNFSTEWYDGGGAIYYQGDPDNPELWLSIVDCTFEDNWCAYQGGAIKLDSAFYFIRDTLIHGNTAGYAGGGLWISGSSGTLVNTEMTGNFSEDDMSSYNGGGCVYLSEGECRMENCLITGNESCSSGGVD